MKTRIAIGTALLLALGTAVAGSLFYKAEAANDSLRISAVSSTSQEPTPETIAMWKATARSSDYIAARVPL